ncbi:MAG TPA: hypothetical protein VFE46_09720 [Pirellulales bacterium]|jgi:hypothetical protein|nr:hypothetical protein [Pirellulales bacterium]
MLCALVAVISKQAVLWTTIGIIGMLGLIAVISPAFFAKVATRSARWVDTRKFTDALDKRIDIDRYVLPFSRLLGVAVLLAVAVLAYVMLRYA